MITHIDPINYRCTQKLSIPTGDLMAVAGANGCGKKAQISAALYRQLSSQVSIQRCGEDALTGLPSALREWPPAGGA